MQNEYTGLVAGSTYIVRSQIDNWGFDRPPIEASSRLWCWIRRTIHLANENKPLTWVVLHG